MGVVLTFGEDADSATKPWEQVLGSTEGTVPADPGGEAVWRTDFYAALKEAQVTGRPLFVTWRCILCKQCAEFDKNVLEGSEKLDPLLRRFVTVRMIDAAQLDQESGGSGSRGAFPFPHSWRAALPRLPGNQRNVFGPIPGQPAGGLLSRHESRRNIENPRNTKKKDCVTDSGCAVPWSRFL